MTDKAKAKGQFRLQLNDVFNPFNCYGMGPMIPGAIDEVLDLADQYVERMNGKDVPIELTKKRNARRE